MKEMQIYVATGTKYNWQIGYDTKNVISSVYSITNTI